VRRCGKSQASGNDSDWGSIRSVMIRERPVEGPEVVGRACACVATPEGEVERAGELAPCESSEAAAPLKRRRESECRAARQGRTVEWRVPVAAHRQLSASHWRRGLSSSRGRAFREAQSPDRRSPPVTPTMRAALARPLGPRC
jgi:hypothetical protein